MSYILFIQSSIPLLLGETLATVQQFNGQQSHVEGKFGYERFSMFFFFNVSLKRCTCIPEILFHACLLLQTLRTPGTEIKRKKENVFQTEMCDM